jgi:hypothetical protein
VLRFLDKEKGGGGFIGLYLAIISGLLNLQKGLKSGVFV